MWISSWDSGRMPASSEATHPAEDHQSLPEKKPGAQGPRRENSAVTLEI